MRIQWDSWPYRAWSKRQAHPPSEQELGRTCSWSASQAQVLSMLKKRKQSGESKNPRVRVPVLSLDSVSYQHWDLGQIAHLLSPRFPHLRNGHVHSTHHIGWLWGLQERILVNVWAQIPARSEHLSDGNQRYERKRITAASFSSGKQASNPNWNFVTKFSGGKLRFQILCPWSLWKLSFVKWKLN